MPPAPEPQNPVPSPTIPAPPSTTPSTTIKVVRIFLLILIIIGLGLIVTQSLWVPTLVSDLVPTYMPVTVSTSSNTATTTQSQQSILDNIATSTDALWMSPDMDTYRFKTYTINNGEVFYTTDYNSTYKLLAGADIATFQIYTAHDNIARDKNYVYIGGNIWSACTDNTCQQKIDLDSATFSTVPSNGVWQYAKDKNGIYYEEGNTGKYFLLKNADPTTFVSFPVVNETYGKDKNTVWFGGSVVQGADAATFTAEDLYGHDATHAYYIGEVILDADPGTYEGLSGAYSKDAMHVYFATSTIVGADAPTFEMISDYEYGKDKNHVYAWGKIMPGVDPTTYEPPPPG